MSMQRTILFWAGFFYLLTFVSIPTLFLYQPVHDPGYLLRKSNDNGVIIGGLLEVFVGLFGIITSVLLYVVLKSQNQMLAVGLIASRIVEVGTMFVGVSFLLGAVSLHQETADVNAILLANTLVVMYDRIFVLGQGFMPGINDLLLGILLYQSRLVPRWLSLIGIAGAFILFAGYFAILFGVIDRTFSASAASAILVAFFEIALGITLLVKGMKKS
jgi:hypothetical protein